MSQPVPNWLSTEEIDLPVPLPPLERRQVALREMEQNVARHEAPEVALTTLPQLNIRALPVTLDRAGAPCADMPFFVPYQGPLPKFEDDRPWPPYREPVIVFEDLIHYAETLEHLFGRYLARPSITTITQGVGDWDSADIFAYRFTYYLVEYAPRPAWCVTKVEHVPGHEFPHLQVHVANGILANDQCLLRAELLAITEIMIDRLESDDFHKHQKAPILLYSFVGSLHARLLHAHYDNGSLIVSYTKFYDFNQMNIPDLELLARWAMSDAVGDTTT